MDIIFEGMTLYSHGVLLFGRDRTLLWHVVFCHDSHQAIEQLLEWRLVPPKSQGVLTTLSRLDLPLCPSMMPVTFTGSGADLIRLFAARAQLLSSLSAVPAIVPLASGKVHFVVAHKLTKDVALVFWISKDQQSHVAQLRTQTQLRRWLHSHAWLREHDRITVALSGLSLPERDVLNLPFVECTGPLVLDIMRAQFQSLHAFPYTQDERN